MPRSSKNSPPEKLKLAPRILTAANDQPWPFRQLLSEIARGLDKKLKFIPLPWRLVWAGLKSAEACGLRLNFRSDSLVSLMHQNPKPDFSPNAAAGLICRPFRSSRNCRTLKLRRLARDGFQAERAHEEAGKNALNAKDDEGRRRNQPAQVFLRGRQHAEMRPVAKSTARAASKIDSRRATRPGRRQSPFRA